MSEMYDNDQRTSFFKKNDDLEIALTDLNQLISTLISILNPIQNVFTSSALSSFHQRRCYFIAIKNV